MLAKNNQEETEAYPAAESASSSDGVVVPELSQSNYSEETSRLDDGTSSRMLDTRNPSPDEALKAEEAVQKVAVWTSMGMDNNHQIPLSPTGAAAKSTAAAFQDLHNGPTSKDAKIRAAAGGTAVPCPGQDDLSANKGGDGAIVPSSRLKAIKYSSDDQPIEEDPQGQATTSLQQARRLATPAEPGAYHMRQRPNGAIEASFHNSLGSLVFGNDAEDDNINAPVAGGDEENQQQAATTPTTNAATAASGGNGDPQNALNDSRSGLARAMPVSDESNRIHDTPVTLMDQDKLVPKETKQWRYLGMALFGVVCVAVGFIVGLLTGNKNGAGSSSTSTTSTSSLAPSLAPPDFLPSSAPTTTLDVFLQELPDYTVANLQDISTPQWKAWDWLSRHPDLPEMPMWRQGQLFALGCFFYAMEGPTAWPEVIRKRWLRYDTNECLWYSSEFGWFDDEDVYQEGLYFYGVEPCNEKGEYQVLALEKLGLEGYDAVHIPPELSWLKALAYLQLRLNGLSVTLSDFLPSQTFYTMTSLRVINLNYNNLVGSIPSEMGLLTNLSELEFWENSLSGSLPTELGLLANMSVFDLAFNGFSGTVPSELALMTNMDAFYLQSNRLTGGVPTQMGLLEKVTAFHLEDNGLSGSLPTELGLMASVVGLWLHENGLSGVLPSQLGLLANATQMSLANNGFEGSMPLELCPWDCKEKINPFPREGFLGRSTSVSSSGCNCTQGATYPLADATHALVINVLFDGWPEETDIVFEEFVESNQTWALLLNVSGGDGDVAYQMSSYSQSALASNTLHRFQATDDWGDGICCGGALSITNGTAAASDFGTPYDGYRGTIMWSTLAFEDFLVEVYLWVDGNGQIMVVSEDEGKSLAAGIHPGASSSGQENDNNGSSNQTYHSTTFTDLLPPTSRSFP